MSALKVMNADMADFTHRDLLEDLGHSTGSFIKNLANEAANKACELYRNYPWAMTFGDPGQFSSGVWDELCRHRPPGLPVPPEPPFTGGQCEGVQYRIRYKVRSEILDSTDYFQPAVWGPISNLRFWYDSSRNWSGGLRVTCRGASIQPGETQLVEHQAMSNDGNNWQRVFTLIAIERIDSQPDNCGNLPAKHPEIPVPSGSRNTTVTVIGGDNISYNIPIIINNSNNYNIEIDADDIKLVFDFGGVTINSNPIYKNTEDIQNNVTNVVTAVNNVNSVATNTNNFVTGTIAFNNPPNSTNHTSSSSSGNAGSADENGEDDLAWVVLELTQIPKNAKSQSGNAAQDVIYAGWFQFTIKDKYLPREPVHFERSVFKAPLGATSFAYTLYQGFQAILTQYRIKDKIK